MPASGLGIAGCSAAWLARLTGGQKVGGSNPLTPTVFRNEPFGEYVEGLSPFRDKNIAAQASGAIHVGRPSANGRIWDIERVKIIGNLKPVQLGSAKLPSTGKVDDCSNPYEDKE